VSRYKVIWEQVTSQGTKSFYRKQRSGLDLSCFIKLSKWLKMNAKNVTNLLILLSVLCGAFF
jgi:hypothetical protein